MTRGPKRHLKRLAAPKSWGLSKMGGTFAPKPIAGPHRSSEAIPLCILLKKLGLASTKKEIKHICRSSLIKVNNRVRTEKNFPVGLFDILTVEKTNEHYRLLYSINKRFYLHKVTPEEAKTRLCRVLKKNVESDIPYTYTEDGFSLRFLDPSIGIQDTLKVDMNNKLIDFLRFEEGKLAMVTRGNNLGCIGVILRIEKHEIGFDMVHLKDANGRLFATRARNCFIIGEVDNPWVTLPKGNGIKKSEYVLSIEKFGELVEDAIEVPVEE